MKLSGDKFELLKYCPDKQIKEDIALKTDDGHVIAPSTHANCLWVYLSADCSVTHHTIETVMKAQEMTGWVLRTFASREPELMVTLWRA